MNIPTIASPDLTPIKISLPSQQQKAALTPEEIAQKVKQFSQEINQPVSAREAVRNVELSAIDEPLSISLQSLKQDTFTPNKELQGIPYNVLTDKALNEKIEQAVKNAPETAQQATEQAKKGGKTGLIIAAVVAAVAAAGFAVKHFVIDKKTQEQEQKPALNVAA